MRIAASASILAGLIGLLAASSVAAEKLPQSQCVLLPVPRRPDAFPSPLLVQGRLKV